MTALATPAPTPWIRAASAALVLAWIALLVPMPRVGLPAGLGLALLAAVLGAVAWRRGARAGLAVLVAALVVSPLVHRFGAPSLAGSAAGTPTAAARPDPARIVRTPAAFRPTFTAVELASALQVEAAAAGTALARQPLLVAGVVLDVAADGSRARLAAGDYPALELRGLRGGFAATLAPGRQVTVACDGARLVEATPVAEGCGKAP